MTVESESLRLTFGSSTLLVVPAIHYRICFAHAVHRICADPATRPEAVAVELGPDTASFVAALLKDLKAHHESMPVMLGLMIKNRLIRPTLKEKALRLQEQTGKDLSEMPPDMLKRELDFCPEVLLPLTPTDSIIEGIRSALEFDLPLHGIDLQETACEERLSPVLIAPPRYPLAGYLAEQAALAAQIPFGESDRRREYAMAARLKTLLQNHRTVLFTCGMAHWRRIRELLLDPEIKPAAVDVPHAFPPENIQQVIIDPYLAVPFLDLFPALALEWEKLRQSKAETSSPPDAGRLFQDILKQAYARYFTHDSSLGNEASPPEALSMETCRRFEGYLANISLLEHRPVPDMHLSLSAALEMLDSRGAQAILDAFMDFPWADPAKFPSYGYLADMHRDDGALLLKDATGWKPVHVRFAHPGFERIPLTQKQLEDKVLLSENQLSGITFSWLPWDRLLSALSAKAIAASQRRPATMTTALGGSLLDGLDIRTTLRAHSRGEKKLYVRENISQPIAPEDHLDGFPVIWIFDALPKSSDYWIRQILMDNQLRPHVRDKGRFDQVFGTSKLISLIGHGHRENDGQLHYDRFCGLLLYHPSCFSIRQQAQWIEHTNYKRVPINRDDSFDSLSGGLPAMFRERYGIDISAHHWTTSLVLMALPFAASSVTVVVPEGFRLDQVVFSVARRFKVAIYQTGLNRFSGAQRERLTRCHYAPCIALEPVCRYEEYVEQQIGENQNAYMEIVPPQVSTFGMTP